MIAGQARYHHDSLFSSLWYHHRKEGFQGLGCKDVLSQLLDDVDRHIRVHVGGIDVRVLCICRRQNAEHLIIGCPGCVLEQPPRKDARVSGARPLKRNILLSDLIGDLRIVVHHYLPFSYWIRFSQTTEVEIMKYLVGLLLLQWEQLQNMTICLSDWPFYD
jgi:hypothetical protein